MFDPNGPGPDDGPKVEITAGDKLVVIVFSKNRETPNGVPMTKFNLKVIAGREKGGKIYTEIGRDCSKQGNYMNWKALCTYAGIQDAIDIDDQQTIQRLFHGVPFGCTITTEQNGKYTNYRMRVLFPGKLTDEDHIAIEAWQLAQQTGGDDEGPPPHDDNDWTPPSRPQPRGNNDDIPFAFHEASGELCSDAAFGERWNATRKMSRC